MEPIRVASGVGTGPTTMAAYDAALGAANAHNYNLVRISSVIPAGATVRTVDRLPDLGSIGDRLTVVEAAAVGEEGATAALAWGRRHSPNRSGSGPGLFYEAATADGDGVETVLETARTGLAAGGEVRDWDLVDRDALTASGTAGTDPHVAAVVVAAYGSGESPL